MNIVIAKFGGTSMGTSSSIETVANIVTKNPGKTVAVVSATSGTTNTLIKIGEQALKKENFTQTLNELNLKHQKIIKELGLNLVEHSESPIARQKSNFDRSLFKISEDQNLIFNEAIGLSECSINLKKYFEEIEKLINGISLIEEISLSAMDKLMGFGERISSDILTAFLIKKGFKARSINAYDIIYTDNNFSSGNVDFKKSDLKICKVLKPLLQKNIIPVVTGFVAQAENGKYITLGRGGSDYTGGILAGALDAKVLEIWTDVDGMYQTDPRLIKEAKLVEKLSFEEASELAYFGAKVLHPKTIKPAINKNIPVKILNTFNLKAKGTIITNKEEESLKSVTSKKNISIINIYSSGMFNAHGFLAKIFDVFARNKVEVDVVSTSEVSVSLTVEGKNHQKVVAELQEFSKVDVEENMSIICLVGNGIKTNPKILGKLFSGLSSHNIKMVSQGSSKRNITFLVPGNEADDVVKKTFKTFF